MDYEVTVSTGSTSVLTDESREEYGELLRLLEGEGIGGRLAEREGAGRGVTWVEVTEIWLASKGLDAVVGWTIGRALDAVADRAKQWVQNKVKRKRESGASVRPQTIIIKSLADVPERRIEVDAGGNVIEYRWIKVDPERLDNQPEVR